jgi:NADH-quinone oxidoreductase subunit N
MLANSINQLITDLPAQIGSDVTAFLSELVLCGTVVALLLGRLLGIDRKMPGHWIAMAGTLIAFGIAFGNVYANGPDAYQVGEDAQLFSGLLVNDGLTVFFRLFLLVFLVLVIALTVLSGIPDNEDGPDFYTLLIGATIGMMLMASANHLLMLFLAVEMASVPSYVMVGFLKGKRLSSEAALKYVVYGAGAAGVMLYGTSLVAGMLGTGQLHLVAEKLGELLSSEGGVGTAMSTAAVRTIVLGVMMILVGLAFKLSLVPFHFWCPDAFEGAPAEVGGFLSVASKAAAFALLIRVVHQLTGFGDLAVPLAIGLGVIAVVSSTFGNLAAYFQTNVKRMLAYSTIAHAGYMLTGVVAMLVALEDGNQMLATDCVEGVLFYLSVYLFMNLGAFAIVALIRNRTYSEEIADYRGLKSECPWLCVMMAVCLFSLVGLPPLGGFVAKFFVLAPVWEAASIHWSMGVLVGFALLNTVFSLFYYLKVPVAMFIADRPEDARPARTGSTEAVFVLLLTAPILLLGMSPLISKLSLAAERVAHDTITVPDADQAGARTSTSPEK